MAGPQIPAGRVITKPVELLSVYPTLLELSGLPPYSRNEGTSLVQLINGRPISDEPYAITTYGRNNHAIRTENFRYIRYEDGSEELYDHTRDPNEWENLANQDVHRQTIKKLKRLLPEVNVHWTQHSAYGYQPYFKDQKARSEAAMKK
jgi:arylsulfatase A-like enzyme